jgi:hypothetical protein
MLIPFGVLSAAAGGVPFESDYELIATEILTTNEASITFSNLGDYSATYKHLQIRAVARNTAVGTGTDEYNVVLNGDTGSNYASHRLVGFGSSVSSSAFTSQQWIRAGWVSRNGNSTGIFSPVVIDITDAFSSTKNTTTRALNGNASAGPSQEIVLFSGLWNNTASITSILLRPDNGSFLAGSRFSLYGIKG